MTPRSLSLALSLLFSPLLLAPPAQARFNDAEMEMMLYLMENEPLTFEQLKKAVGEGLDPKAPLPQQFTHLHWAAQVGDRDSIRYLLELGCDINARNALQRTPLMLACANASREVVEELLQRGAHPNDKDADGQSLVFFACQNRDVEVLRFLLDAGHKLSDIKPCFYYQDAFGLACSTQNLNVALYLAELGEVKDKDAALFRCVNHQSERMLPLAEWLLDHGASAKAKHAGGGGTILHDACDAQCLKLAELLIARGADINAQDDFGNTPLSSSCSGNNMAGTLVNPCVELLLKHGAKTEIVDKNGYTALLTACQNNRMDAMRQLLQYGAKIDVTDPNAPRSPLQFALSRGNVEMMRLLVSHGASLDEILYTWTLLRSALYAKQFEVARYLLAEGQDINARDKEGQTYLMEAAIRGWTEAAQFLLENGADSSLKDKSGNTALSLAQRYNYPAIVKLIETAAKPPVTAEE